MSIRKISALLLVLGIISAAFPTPALAEGPPELWGLTKEQIIQIAKELAPRFQFYKYPTPSTVPEGTYIGVGFKGVWHYAREVLNLPSEPNAYVLEMDIVFQTCKRFLEALVKERLWTPGAPVPGVGETMFIIIPGWRGILFGGLEQPRPWGSLLYCNQSGCFQKPIW